MSLCGNLVGSLSIFSYVAFFSVLLFFLAIGLAYFFRRRLRSVIHRVIRFLQTTLERAFLLPLIRRLFWIPILALVTVTVSIPLLFLSTPASFPASFHAVLPDIPMWAKVIIAGALPVLWTAFADLWRHSAVWYVNRNICDRDTYVFAYDAIDFAVSDKLKRYGEFAEDQLHSQSLEEVYFAVTKPKEQITSIVRALYQFLRVSLRIKNLEVVLAKVEDQDTLEKYIFLPTDQKPNNDLFDSGRAPESFFYSVLRSRRPQVIPDIAFKMRYKASSAPHYVPITSDDGNRGSIYGFPVENSFSEKIVYVLTLKTNEPRIFDNSFDSRFRPIIKAFAKRILLEDRIGEIRKVLYERYERDRLRRSDGANAGNAGRGSQGV